MNYWIHGESGSGKTSLATSLVPEATLNFGVSTWEKAAKTLNEWYAKTPVIVEVFCCKPPPEDFDIDDRNGNVVITSVLPPVECPAVYKCIVVQTEGIGACR